MKATKKSINAALKSKGIKAEIFKGEGYYYFYGDDVDLAAEQGVYGVLYLHELTLDQWIAEAMDRVTETAQKRR